MCKMLSAPTITTAQLLPAKQLWLPLLTTGQPRPPAQRSLLVAPPPPAIAYSSSWLKQGATEETASLEKLAEAAKRAAEAGAHVVSSKQLTHELWTCKCHDDHNRM